MFARCADRTHRPARTLPLETVVVPTLVHLGRPERLVQATLGGIVGLGLTRA